MPIRKITSGTSNLRIASEEKDDEILRKGKKIKIVTIALFAVFVALICDILIESYIEYDQKFKIDDKKAKGCLL